MSVPTARGVAHDILLRVAQDGAWAERVLSSALGRSGLAPRDRALATELVYGTLRHQSWLDFLLGSFARKPLAKLPVAVLVALRLTAYQIVCSRIPDYSAVNEGVSLVRRRHSHLAGVANAVLRKVADHARRDALPDPKDRFDDPMAALGVRHSLPLWLVRRVAALRGYEEAQEWAAANNEPPALSLRVNTLRSTRGELAAILADAGVEARVADAFPDGLLVKGGAVESLPGYEAGLFAVQDLAAQMVGRLVAARPGDLILDACAAPGGKSTHLAEQMGGEGRVVAMDIHRGKTRLITANAARLGIGCITTVVGDASDPDAVRAALGVAGSSVEVDAVMLDAPCSGTGTLRRHPELRYRLSDDTRTLCARQDALLESVAELVKPGGHIVYAVCSILPEEGEERVARFLDAHPDFSIAEPPDPAVRPFLASDNTLRTWPHLHGVDGFFAARLQRRE